MTRRPIEGSAEHPIDLMDFSYGPIVLLDYEPLEPVADTTGKSVSYQADSTRIRTPRRRANFETPRREYAPDPEVGAQRNAQHKDHSEQTASRKRGLSNPVSLPNRDRGFQERSLSPPHDNRYRRLRNRSSSPPREFNRKAERLRLAIIDAEIYDFATSRDNENRFFTTTSRKKVVTDEPVPESPPDQIAPENYLSQLVPDEAILCWHHFSKRHPGFHGCRYATCKYFHDPMHFQDWMLRSISVELLDQLLFLHQNVMASRDKEQPHYMVLMEQSRILHMRWSAAQQDRFDYEDGPLLRYD